MTPPAAALVNETGIDSANGGVNNEFFADVNNTSTTVNDTFHVWVVCIHGSVGGSD